MLVRSWGNAGNFARGAPSERRIGCRSRVCALCSSICEETRKCAGHELGRNIGAHDDVVATAMLCSFAGKAKEGELTVGSCG